MVASVRAETSKASTDSEETEEIKTAAEGAALAEEARDQADLLVEMKGPCRRFFEHANKLSHEESAVMKGGNGERGTK